MTRPYLATHDQWRDNWRTLLEEKISMSDPIQFASAITTERDVDCAATALVDEIRGQIDAADFDFAMAFFSANFARWLPRARIDCAPRSTRAC
jgi:hypothetical protein